MYNVGFITTDVKISKSILYEALSNITDIKDTFNMISVDGDTSTNDTVLLLANGTEQQTLKLQRKTKGITNS